MSKDFLGRKTFVLNGSEVLFSLSIGSLFPSRLGKKEDVCPPASGTLVYGRATHSHATQPEEEEAS
jgi:hypothetical protein